MSFSDASSGAGSGRNLVCSVLTVQLARVGQALEQGRAKRTSGRKVSRPMASICRTGRL